MENGAGSARLAASRMPSGPASHGRPAAAAAAPTDTAGTLSGEGITRGYPRRLQATIRALVTMNQHSMLALPADATDADLDQLVDTLVTIWERATLLADTGQPGDPQQGQ